MTFEAVTAWKNCSGLETLRQELRSYCVWGICVPSTFQRKLFYLGKKWLCNRTQGTYICYTGCFFFFFLPLGANGFSPEYPILTFLSILASGLFHSLSLRKECSTDSPALSIPSLWDANCLYLGAWCCAVGNVLGEGNPGSQQVFRYVGKLSQTRGSLGPLRSEHLGSWASEGRMQLGPYRVAPSPAHLKPRWEAVANALETTQLITLYNLSLDSVLANEGFAKGI